MTTQSKITKLKKRVARGELSLFEALDLLVTHRLREGLTEPTKLELQFEERIQRARARGRNPLLRKCTR